MRPYYLPFDFCIQVIRMLIPLIALYVFGWIGIAYWIVLLVVYYQVLRIVFEMQRLSALDEFFLLDHEKNRSNIITVVKMDKVKDYEKLRSEIIRLAIVHPRLAHSLKKFLGEYFFVKMTPAQLEKAKQECFIRNDAIKSDEDIADFSAKEQIARDPLDTL